MGEPALEPGVPMDWPTFLGAGLGATRRFVRSMTELFGGLAALDMGGGEEAGPPMIDW